jgi:hypothetical protein
MHVIMHNKDLIYLHQARKSAGSCENSNEPSGFIDRFYTTKQMNTNIKVV